MKTSNYISIILLSFLGLFLFIFWYNYQQPLNYEICPKCDGSQYLNIYKNFYGETGNLNVSFPFNTRIFVPFLASLVPLSYELLNFHFINILFIICSLSTIYLLWRKLKISTSLKIVGFFWLLFHWMGIIRHNLFDVANIDTPLFFFSPLLLLIIYKKKYWLLPLLSVFATSQKESFPAYLIILLIYAFVHNKFYEKYFNLIPILVSVIISFITKFTISHFFPSANESVSSFVVVLYHIKQIFINPESIVIWLISIFTSYGAFLLLTTTSKTEFKSSPENNIVFIFALLSLGLSLVAGGDFTRISFLGFPFVMTWILMKVNSSSILEIGVALLLSIPIMRLFTSIPQPNYEQLSHPWIVEISSIENISYWGLYMIICYLILNRVSKIIQ